MLVIRLAPVRSLIEVLVFEKEMFLKNILLINSSEKKPNFSQNHQKMTDWPYILPPELPLEPH